MFDPNLDFGVKNSLIKKTCIFTPVLLKGLLEYFNIKNFKKTKLYSSGNNDYFTLIHSHISPAFTGDAVLYLKDTPCENIILFGSCGLVKKNKKISIGSIVCPLESYSFESFSDLLAKKISPKKSKPDNYLLKNFLKFSQKENICPVKCATFGSIKLEYDYKNYLLENKFDIMDMESSAFFNAASFVNKKALAVLFATDILNKNNIFDSLNDNKNLISNSIRTTSKKILEFVKTLN